MRAVLRSQWSLRRFGGCLHVPLEHVLRSIRQVLLLLLLQLRALPLLLGL